MREKTLFMFAYIYIQEFWKDTQETKSSGWFHLWRIEIGRRVIGVGGRYTYVYIYLHIYIWTIWIYNLIKNENTKTEKKIAHPGQAFSKPPFKHSKLIPLLCSLSPVPTIFSGIILCYPAFIHPPLPCSPRPQPNCELFESSVVSFTLVTPAHGAVPDVWWTASTRGSGSGKREVGQTSQVCGLSSVERGINSGLHLTVRIWRGSEERGKYSTSCRKGIPSSAKARG